MKRILIIGLTERMGGVETFIYNTTVFSDKKKYEYDYLVHGADNCVYQKEIMDFYGSQNHFFFIRKYKADPIGCIKDLITFYRKNGRKYDYVHLQTGAAQEVMYVFPFCFFVKARVISHSHNAGGYHPAIHRLFRPIVNLVSARRLACSQEAADWLFGSGGKAFVMINNGIDTGRFTFDRRRRKHIRGMYGLNDEFVIGHVGRFSAQKNHPFLLSIFQQILEKKKDAKLMLVGVGERFEDIKKLVAELGLQKHVIFCGRQMNIPDYYSAFDVFLMPSLYEGLPIVGIEAQCEGLPCFFSSAISSQVRLTDRVHILDLEMPAVTWAEEIVKHTDCQNRERYPDDIEKSGFSIRATIGKLEKVYEV